MLVLTIAFITGCIKDDDEELKAEEERLLEQYLIDNNITQEPTSSGLYYIPIVEGTGHQPGDSTWIEIRYIGELVDGTVFSTNDDSVAMVHDLYQESYLYGPTRLQIGNISIAGLSEGLQYMYAGGRGKFIIPSYLAYGSASLNLIPPYSTLIYTIDLLAAFESPDQHESELIQAYLDENDLSDEPTESGLYYFEQDAGTGDTIKPGDRVQVWYTASFLDGRVFDSNIEGDLLDRVIPDEYIIPGLNEGFMLMQEGSKGIFIIPYYLAYGTEGFVDGFGMTLIPPYMTILFEIEVEKVNPD